MKRVLKKLITMACLALLITAPCHNLHTQPTQATNTEQGPGTSQQVTAGVLGSLVAVGAVVFVAVVTSMILTSYRKAYGTPAQKAVAAIRDLSEKRDTATIIVDSLKQELQKTTVAQQVSALSFSDLVTIQLDQQAISSMQQKAQDAILTTVEKETPGATVGDVTYIKSLNAEITNQRAAIRKVITDTFLATRTAVVRSKIEADPVAWSAALNAVSGDALVAKLREDLDSKLRKILTEPQDTITKDRYNSLIQNITEMNSATTPARDWSTAYASMQRVIAQDPDLKSILLDAMTTTITDIKPTDTSALRQLDAFDKLQQQVRTQPVSLVEKLTGKQELLDKQLQTATDGFVRMTPDERSNLAQQPRETIFNTAVEKSVRSAIRQPSTITGRPHETIVPSGVHSEPKKGLETIWE